jgi:LPXTG-site transpeptidase (sortase) family protein
VSLQRELLVLLLSFVSLVFFFRAGSLFLQQYFIIPGTHPLLAQAEEIAPSESMSELDADSLLFPRNIEIPERGILAPLVPSIIADGNWEVNTHSASLLVQDGELLAENGFIIYGHNTAAIFSKLQQVKAGDEITLRYTDGRELVYSVVSTVVVSADERNVLEYAQEDTILVYTCVGFLDRERFVVIGKRI